MLENDNVKDVSDLSLWYSFEEYPLSCYAALEEVAGRLRSDPVFADVADEIENVLPKITTARRRLAVAAKLVLENTEGWSRRDDWDWFEHLSWIRESEADRRLSEEHDEADWLYGLILEIEVTQRRFRRIDKRIGGIIYAIYKWREGDWDKASILEAYQKLTTQTP